MSYSTDLYLTASHRRIISSTTSSQLSTQRRTINSSHGLLHPAQGYTSFHLKRHTHLMGIFLSQVYTTFHLCFKENDTPNSWASSLHRGTHRSISVSERNDTPISWAHPTHGLFLRLTHSVCVLEDVLRSCNHQHSLSTREAFSITPSLTRKYSNYVLAVVINTPS
jgi:hypothetical protein